MRPAATAATFDDVTQRAKALLAATAVFLAVAVTDAIAGTYDVLACGYAPNGENNVWTSSTSAPSHISIGTTCPPGSGEYDGLRAFDDFAAPTDAPAGATAEWTFTAPAGTTIARWRYERKLGKYSDPNWTVYTKNGQGTILDTCTYTFPADACGYSALERDITGLSTDRLDFGFRCDAGGSCAIGFTAHRVWAALRASRVTLEENTLPAVGAPSGALVSGSGWHSGSEGVSFTAADGSPGVGIKETRIYVDNQLLAGSAIVRSCDFTQKIPCNDPAGAITHTVDTTQLADGQRQVEVAAVDAANNERRAAAVTVRIDNDAPTATITATKPDTDPYTRQLQASWGGNDAGAGVVDYDVDVAINDGPFVPWLTDTTATSATYTGTGGNRYSFRVRATDATGKLSPYATIGPVEIFANPNAPPPAGGVGGGDTPPPAAGDPAPAGSPPPTEDPPPVVRPRATPTLRVRSARRHASGLEVTGAISRGATGRVTLTYSARVRGRTLRVRRLVRVGAGRFRARLGLGRSLASVRRGRLEVRYGGDERYRPRVVRRTVGR